MSSSTSPYTPLGWKLKQSILPLSRREVIAILATSSVLFLCTWGWNAQASFSSSPASSTEPSKARVMGILEGMKIKEGGRRQKLESLYGMGSFEGRTWLDHIEALDPEGLAPLTQYTQRYLFEWQNPPLHECANKKFLKVNLGHTSDNSHGLGSTVHVLTFQLRNALDSGRILAWDDETLGRAYVDELCRVDGVRNFDCVFESLTHCPRSAMTARNTAYVGALHDVLIDDVPEGAWRTPEVFRKALQGDSNPPKYTDHMLKYWWRGQGAAYLMRIRREGLAWISQSRLKEDSHHGWRLRDNDGSATTFPMPWPLPKGTMNMHVRHGDKGSEMKLIPFTDFVTAGAELAAQNPNSYMKMAFVSSEDPEVFQQMHKIAHLSDAPTTPTRDWVWFASDINRLNSGPVQQLEAFGNRTETTLSWMAELFIAMECDAFIGTRGSNWNRLIDELRCVWTPACMQPYIEVGPAPDWDWYNW